MTTTMTDDDDDDDDGRDDCRVRGIRSHSYLVRTADFTVVITATAETSSTSRKVKWLIKNGIQLTLVKQ